MADSQYKLEFEAEATLVSSRKLASLDRECSVKFVTDQTNVMELAAFDAQTRFKVTVEVVQ